VWGAGGEGGGGKEEEGGGGKYHGPNIFTVYTVFRFIKRLFSRVVGRPSAKMTKLILTNTVPDLTVILGGRYRFLSCTDTAGPILTRLDS
jgi:hypothetical protein